MDKLIEKMLQITEQRLEIISVSDLIVPRSKGVLSYVKIRFTPLYVYTHSKTYDKLRKDIFSVTNQYKKYIHEIGSEMLPGFRDRGFVIHFKLGTDVNIMEKLVKQLKNLIGRVYEEE